MFEKVIGELEIKLCETLPLNITLFEMDGFCRNPNDICDYCRRNIDDNYLCCKVSYTYLLKSRLV